MAHRHNEEDAMASISTILAMDVVKAHAIPLTGNPADLDPLLEQIGTSPFVLIGEASHGTHEFYRTRAQITQRLIAEKGFRAVAIEGDWPDAYRVHKYLQGAGKDRDAAEALSGFQRFPAWMWRNADVLNFVGWARAFNDALAPEVQPIGFYGLDLYSLHASMAAVIEYLQHIDPPAATRARGRYACFDVFGCDPQAYGYAAGLGLSHSCEGQVIEQLVDLHRKSAEYAHRDGWAPAEDFFSAEENARLVRDAEVYYRTMFLGDVSSWNLRDTHMAQTFDRLASHLRGRYGTARVVVWAHNSHVGDARATAMGSAGEMNLGQLIREKYGRQCCSVGFTTYAGTVTAASEWGSPAEIKRVLPGRAGSYEGLFHDIGLPAFLLQLRSGTPLAQALAVPLRERAIGVIYKPETELRSHYFAASLAQQFDAVIHFDQTRAVEPLETIATGSETEPPETYPTGI
jgi:erythromycin esterase-like protein